MNFSRKDFEKQGLAADGVIYITAGQTCNIHCSAFIATSVSVIGSVTSSDVRNVANNPTNLAGVSIPNGMMIPIPNTTSFTLTSGSGFLILNTRESL